MFSYYNYGKNITIELYSEDLSTRDINELSSTGREQSAQIKSLQKEIKDKNSLIEELDLHNYELNHDLKTSEIKEKSLRETMELLNAANDNFKGLLEKYRFLLENNITVKKRSMSTKKPVKPKKTPP